MFHVYCQRYKKRFSGIKFRKFPVDKFYTWSKAARAAKATFAAEEITSDKFKAWLELM